MKIDEIFYILGITSASFLIFTQFFPRYLWVDVGCNFMLWIFSFFFWVIMKNKMFEAFGNHWDENSLLWFLICLQKEFWGFSWKFLFRLIFGTRFNCIASILKNFSYFWGNYNRNCIVLKFPLLINKLHPLPLSKSYHKIQSRISLIESDDTLW